MPLERIAVDVPQGGQSGGERVWVKPTLEERTLASFALLDEVGMGNDQAFPTFDSQCC